MLAHADILLAKPVGPGKIDCKIEEGDAGTVFQVKIFKLEQLPEHCSWLGNQPWLPPSRKDTGLLFGLLGLGGPLARSALTQANRDKTRNDLSYPRHYAIQNPFQAEFTLHNSNCKTFWSPSTWSKSTITLQGSRILLRHFFRPASLCKGNRGDCKGDW